GARRAPPHAARGHRRVAARVPEPPLRPALRALALDRSPPGRARVPLGATAPARGGAPGAAQALSTRELPSRSPDRQGELMAELRVARVHDEPPPQHRDRIGIVAER